MQPNEVREKIAEKAATDAGFRARLLSDPKETLEEELSVPIPATMSIEVHEESDTTAHLVIPPGSRLSEGELEAVTGGGQSRLFGRNVDSAISHW